MVLILFPAALSALPLTRTLYLVPPDMLDISIGVDYLFSGKQVVRERFSAGAGLWSGVSLNAEFDALDTGIAGFDSPGDTFLEFAASIDRLSPGRLRTAWYCTLRFPTGPDVYKTDDYTGAALGFGEIRTGPAAAFGFSPASMFFINLFYTFRQDKNEDFYAGFRLNPSRTETYKALFGLNPFYKNAFLDYRRMTNDYFTISGAWIYSGFMPLVFFTEVYYSRRFVRSGDAAMSLPVEGGGASPLFVCAGIKYFITGSVFISGYGMFNLMMDEDYRNLQAGIFCNLIF